MNPNLEKNLLKPETNESLPKQELVNLDQEGFEKLSQETEKGINSSTETLINKGSEFFDDIETKDYPDIKRLEELNQETVKLKDEAIDSVKWIKKRFNLDKSQKELFDGIEIQGSNEFREKIKNSLDILALSPEKFNFSKKYIERIQEWGRSAINMFKDKPTFEIGDMWKESDEIFLASQIAHDSYHSYLCYSSQENNGIIIINDFSGKEAEKKCLDFQIKTLEDIQSHEKMKSNHELIDEHKKYLTGLAVNPTYQDIPYEERNW